VKVLVRRGQTAAIRAVQEIPLNNSFATGRLSSCPVAEIDAYATPLEPDGTLAAHVRERLAEGQSLRQIALAMDVSWKQVLGVAMAELSAGAIEDEPDLIVSSDGVGTRAARAPLGSFEPAADDTPHERVQFESGDAA
jgi:hypothetical protein